MEAGNRCKDECLPEESSFFTSVGHPFPAVCIRTSTERPEALDKACFFIADIEENVSIKVARIVSFILRNFATYGLQRHQF